MSVSLPSIASFHQGAHSVAVVGLGYVGLPLAVAFARHFNVIGFDLNAARVEELSAGTDRTGEVDSAALQASTARFTSDPAALREAGQELRPHADGKLVDTHTAGLGRQKMAKLMYSNVLPLTSSLIAS